MAVNYYTVPRAHRAIDELARELREMRPLYDHVYDHYAPFPSMRSLVDECRQWDTQWDGLEKKAHVGKDGFKVSLDVQHFSPDEISVKTENNHVVIKAKHEEKRDQHGYVSRYFTRRYELPDGYKSDEVSSSLSSDGVLTIKAPRRKQKDDDEDARYVKIEKTGPVRMNNKDQVTKMY